MEDRQSAEWARHPCSAAGWSPAGVRRAGSNVAILKMVVAATMAAGTVSLAAGQIVIDNFNDGIHTPLWLVSDPPADGFSVAGFSSDNGGLRTTTDFKVRITLKFTSPVPAHACGATKGHMRKAIRVR